jgi:hypothetical protein
MILIILIFKHFTLHYMCESSYQDLLLLTLYETQIEILETNYTLYHTQLLNIFNEIQFLQIILPMFNTYILCGCVAT